MSEDERAEIRFKKIALLQVRSFIDQLLQELDKAEKDLDEVDKSGLMEFDLPVENDETERPLGWLRKQVDAAERSGWVSDVVYDSGGSVLRFRLKQSDKRGQFEKWVNWVWGVAEKKGVKKGG